MNHFVAVAMLPCRALYFVLCRRWYVHLIVFVPLQENLVHNCMECTQNFRGSNSSKCNQKPQEVGIDEETFPLYCSHPFWNFNSNSNTRSCVYHERSKVIQNKTKYMLTQTLGDRCMCTHTRHVVGKESTLMMTLWDSLKVKRKKNNVLQIPATPLQTMSNRAQSQLVLVTCVTELVQAWTKHRKTMGA